MLEVEVARIRVPIHEEKNGIYEKVGEEDIYLTDVRQDQIKQIGDVYMIDADTT